MTRVSLFILGAWLVTGVVVLVAAVDVQGIALDRILMPPAADAPLGYDDLGRSVAARLAVGAQTSLAVALSVVLIAMAAGTLLGCLGGWYGGTWDRLLVAIMDVFMAFPGLLLAIALAALLGPGLSNAILALAVVGWVGFARLARSQTLSVREREHVQAARALGVRAGTILRRHVLPLILAPLVVQATFELAGAVIAESTLSFLGIGVQPPQPSWGSMIRDGMRYMLIAPHVVLAPGLAIFLVVLSINHLGDRLRDRMDVREAARAGGE